MNSLNPLIRDSRPMGLNNLNELVHRQLGKDGFQTVRVVYDNLLWLHQLCENLGGLLSLSQNIHSADVLNQYMGDIVKTSQHLNDVVTLNNSLPYIKEIAPRIEAFSKSIEELNLKVTNAELNVDECIKTLNNNLKNLSDLSIQYETELGKLIQDFRTEICETQAETQKNANLALQQIKKMHTDISSQMPSINRAVENQNKIHSTLLHLVASDAVLTAIFTKDEADFEFALHKIKDSEKVGNNEQILRKRLNYKPTGTRVLEALTT